MFDLQNHPVWELFLGPDEKLAQAAVVRLSAQNDSSIGLIARQLFVEANTTFHFYKVRGVARSLAIKIGRALKSAQSDEERKLAPYRVAVEMFPGSLLAARAHFSLGIHYFEKREEGAASHFKEVTRLTTLYKAAEAFLKLAELEKSAAKTHYLAAAALKHSPCNERAYLELGKIEEAEGKYAQAVKYYRGARAAFSEAYLRLALIYEVGREGAEKNLEWAIKYYEKAILEGSSHIRAEAHLRLGNLQKREGKVASNEWINHYQCAALVREFSCGIEAKLCLGEAYLEIKKYRAAKECCLAVLKQTDSEILKGRAELVLGHICWALAGKEPYSSSLREAIDHYGTAIRLAEGAVANEARFSRASLLMLEGEFQNLPLAKVHLDSVIETSDGEMKAKALLEYANMKRGEEATACLEGAFTCGSHRVSFLAAIQLAERLQSESWYRRAFELAATQSEKDEILMKISGLLRKQEKLDQAIASYQAVLETKSSNFYAEAYYWIGYMQWQLGNVPLACAAFISAKNVPSYKGRWSSLAEKMLNSNAFPPSKKSRRF